MDPRSVEKLLIEVNGEEYEVQAVETPFREGVELHCRVGGSDIRVSDRGLGRHEALRLIKEEIKAKLNTVQGS